MLQTNKIRLSSYIYARSQLIYFDEDLRSLCHIMSTSKSIAGTAVNTLLQSLDGFFYNCYVLLTSHFDAVLSEKKKKTPVHLNVLIENLAELEKLKKGVHGIK